MVVQLDHQSNLIDWIKFVDTLPTHENLAADSWLCMTIKERARYLKVCSESEEIASIEKALIDFNFKNRKTEEQLRQNKLDDKFTIQLNDERFGVW